ncbi:hypothetical protein RRG08_056630 [Elysia crispata]|uniref:Uncharacterized protein n=1 Tax=Elysia crispata TaxID=231223 RepID=A0AAE1D9G6_9GAST|nr:hypothetical protein RRG08_056630 [Elysia crispata]
MTLVTRSLQGLAKTRSRYKPTVVSTRIGQDKISLQTYSGLYKDWSRQDLATNLQWSLQGLIQDKISLQTYSGLYKDWSKQDLAYKPTVVSARIGQDKDLAKQNLQWSLQGLAKTRSRYKPTVVSTRIGQDKISLQTYSGLYKDWSRQDLATNLQWSLQGLAKTRSWKLEGSVR